MRWVARGRYTTETSAHTPMCSRRPLDGWSRRRALQAVAEPARRLANAAIYLEAFGHVVAAWIWLEQALVAGGRPGAFYDGKRQACRWFYRCELPRTAAQFELLDRLDDTTLMMRDEWY